MQTDALSPAPAHRRWGTRDAALLNNRRPLIMGIVNVTPDSFSDGGQHDSVSSAVEHALSLVADGADILDIGGESTRPGATPVSLDEELRRTVAVVRTLAEVTDTSISIDTTKAAVAEACLDAGALIVNDISGLTYDGRMPAVVAASGAAVVCMHIRGTPANMQDNPVYNDVVEDVAGWLQRRLDELADAGVPADRVLLDPGIGFGKTAGHNLALLRGIGSLHALGRPVLIGHSRKRFLGKLLGRQVNERSAGTVGVSVAAAFNGADVLRVHDVRSTRDAIDAFRAVAIMNEEL